MKLKLHYFLTFFALMLFAGVSSQTKVWKKAKINKESKSSKFQNLDSKSYQTFSLDFNAFKEQFKNVVNRNQLNAKSNVIVNFPNVKGELEAFRIYEAPVLSEEMSLLYPRLKTYVGYSTDGKGTRIRFSVTPHGVQTMTSYLDKPTVFTVPVEKGTNTEYITYTRNARINSVKDFECLTEDEYVPIKNVLSTGRDANDQTLRTFRIAVSVNGEYTNFWDDGNAATGTPQEDALAQVISTLNRNNEVFEVDMAITFTLVNGVQYNGSDLIFADGTTDPYTSSYNSQLQSTLTSVVGEANYDIGHLFVYASSTNGNAGCIGCVCVNGSKGSGFSQHPFTDNDGGAYMSDFFDIDYVPHEIGHQMGGNHTFSQSNEGVGVNAEPGSGTTIMGYAGITGSNDVQDHSDPHFHYNTINQVLTNLQTRTCWVGTAITNNPPVSDAGSDYTIPQGTAFVLRGAATDPDGGDFLSYNWEQIDDGGSTTTSGNFGPTRTDGPLFRSRPPSTSPDRYMPVLSRVVSGQLTQTNPTETADNSSWETVATVAREMNFALIIRDRSEAGGAGQMPQTDFDTMKVTVDASGPFVVTSQTSNEMWDAGSSQTITWDVAGTDTGNVNTPTVNILLSVDGGVTFPYTVATNVPNDGSQGITVPATGGDTTTARIIVEGNNNVFYAMNSTNFSIQESEFALAVANSEVEVCSPNDAVYNFTYNTFLGFTGTTTFSANDLPAGATAAFNPTTATADGTSVTATISGIAGVAQGSHDFTLVGTSGTITKNASATLNVFNGAPGNLTLTSPTDGNTGEPLVPTLMWDADANAASYDVEVATDNTFTTIISSGNVASNSYALTGLNQTTTYYWRVKGKNLCGDGSFSSVFSFTTISCTVCTSVGNTTFATATTKVVFNTIDNASTKVDGSGTRQGYFDYTSISTTVKRGESHTITVHADTDGNYLTNSIVWIDWNQDCDFDDADETYDLGEIRNVEDGATDLSPLSITIPNGASIGSTVMRVTTRYSSDPSSCTTSTFDGEVEDYTVTVEEATTSVEDFAFSGFNLYPNPSTGKFTLNLEVINTDKVSVQLFDIRGRLVNQKDFFNTNANFSEEVDFNKTASGLYLVKITNGNKQTTRKLVIQ